MSFSEILVIWSVICPSNGGRSTYLAFATHFCNWTSAFRQKSGAPRLVGLFMDFHRFTDVKLHQIGLNNTVNVPKWQPRQPSPRLWYETGSPDESQPAPFVQVTRPAQQHCRESA
ncbi:hypothetical protein K470DRAFT_264633 [Piedraia hortae CBS 480.64]|uniref:Uncharacterized protein n=1 Tax=Piedraia hortae CBS 480.64 TaxID=1314780 RepID=A0A6A7BY50_9PEZI|nr:hypothetical protein K470DRAFT_264633 [Piedraia hortae CBS 480.64]